MVTNLHLLVGITLVSLLCGHSRPEDGQQKLIAIDVNPENRLQLVRELQKEQKFDVDLINPHSGNGSSLLIIVSGDGLPTVSAIADKYKANNTDQTHRLQRSTMIAKQRHSLQREQLKKCHNKPPQCNVKFDYSKYHTMDEIYAQLKTLNKIYPNQTQLLRIGTSYEGRPLTAMRIGTNKSKPIVWIDAGIHGREWIGPAAALYFIKQLVENDGHMDGAMGHYNFYILPVLNPDGYEYTWTRNRMWRKSRSKNKCTFIKCCYGVDLDRNFEFDFANNHYPCRSDYSGPEPLSEPETKAIRNFFIDHYSQTHLYISLHSFGQRLLTPYGARQQDSVNHWPSVALGRHFLQAADINDHYYLMDKAYDVEYKTGQAIDYVASTLDVPFAYSLLLRPSDEDAWDFDLPESQIIPASLEAYQGLTNMIGVLKKYTEKAVHNASTASPRARR